MTKVCSSILFIMGSLAAQAFPGAIQAQQLSESELSKLPPEVAQQLAKIPIKDILSGKVKIKSPLPPSTERDSDWMSPLPVTLHLRGTTGTLLPVKEKLVAERKETAKRNTRRQNDSTILLEKATKDFGERLTKVLPLPECHRDQKTYSAYATPNGDSILQDMLFVSPEQVPLDSDEAFGDKTIIIKYSQEHPSSWMQYARLEGIKCLPTRIRISGRGVYRLEGLPALKNYQSDIHGEGILSDAVKAKVRRWNAQSDGGV